MASHGRVRQVGDHVPDPLDQANVDKFWDVIGRDRNPHACWLWPLHVHPVNRFGTFCLIGGRRVDAGRFILSVAQRPPIGGEIVKRRCGENQCVNPGHMEWHTRSKRQKAAVAEGKLPMPPTAGEENAAACLTEEQVMFIRQSEMTGKALGKLFGVSASTISMAQLGMTWAHLPGARTRRRVGNTNGGDFIEL